MESRERGSALVIALLVAFVLSILGVSFLMMTQAESQIARNERLALQALHVAESGARLVLGWFDRPGAALGFPSPADVDRSQRVILSETDPYGSVLAGPYPPYKNGVDLDGNGADDLFDRPYRGGIAFEHLFMGTEEGPDVRIDRDAGGAYAAFLDQLSQMLFDSYPSATGAGPPRLTARITRIDAYAPPYVRMGAEWGRFGVATVKVTGGIFHEDAAGALRLMSRQTVRLVLNEVPYGTPVFGPVHTCGALRVGDAFGPHWGTVTALGSVTSLDGSPLDISLVAPSIPRSLPPGPRLDRLWTEPADPGSLDPYLTTYTGASIPDPWLRLIARGTFDPGIASPGQAAAPDWDGGCCDHSNIMQGHDLVGCSAYDYEFWKNLALSGRRNVHYFAFDEEGGGFKENGVGTAQSIQELTQGRIGVFFFDTENGQAPHDKDGNGTLDNLVPGDVFIGGDWSAQGMLFVNAETLRTVALNVPSSGPSTVLRAPGEPFLDGDNDRHWDSGEAWVNLGYPGTLSGAFGLDPSDGLKDDGSGGGAPMRNRLGPGIDARVNFQGILYNTGAIRLGGSGRFFGSVIGRGDIECGTASGAPDLYWDASIGVDWPPPAWSLPRVAVTRWIIGG